MKTWDASDTMVHTAIRVEHSTMALHVQAAEHSTMDHHIQVVVRSTMEVRQDTRGRSEAATLPHTHRTAAVHSAVALPVVAVEVPLAEAIAVGTTAAGLAKAEVTAAEAVVSAEAVKIRTSAFIIRWTSRIGHFA